MSDWGWPLLSLLVGTVLLLVLVTREKRRERRRRMDRGREWVAKHGHRSFRR